MTARWMVTAMMIGAMVVWLSAAPARVSADGCYDACRAEGIASFLVARAAVKSCKLECDDPASRSECRQACRSALREARDSVISALRECRQECEPASSCRGECLAPARECLAPVGGEVRTCARNCKIAARDGARACAGETDLRACRIEVAGQLLGCAQACGAGARKSAAPCASSLRTCVEECRPVEDSCRSECLASGQSCIAPTVTESKACVEACGLGTFQAAGDCLRQPGAIRCLIDLAGNALQCARGCQNAGLVGVHECSPELKDCLRECSSDPCGNACRVFLESCLEPVVTETEACMKDCVMGGYQDGTACMMPLSKQCLSEAATGVLECAESCKTSVEVAGTACKDEFLTCQEECGS